MMNYTLDMEDIAALDTQNNTMHKDQILTVKFQIDVHKDLTLNICQHVQYIGDVKSMTFALSGCSDIHSECK